MKTNQKKSSDSKATLKTTVKNTKISKYSDEGIRQRAYEINFQINRPDKHNKLKQPIWLNIPLGFKL